MSDTPRVDAVYNASAYDEKETWRESYEKMMACARRLERELAVARKGLEAIASLIDESNGIGGLHLNGDFAPWSELRTGGRFEEWLVAFDDALNAARSSNPGFQGTANSKERKD